MQVTTKRLNEQVKRNVDRFPDNFIFQLIEKEYESPRSQVVTLEAGCGYMLSAVLNSKVAMDVSIEIIRTFMRLRGFTLHYNALGKQLIGLERKNDNQFKKVFGILDSLMEDTQKVDEKVMGFIKNA